MNKIKELFYQLLELTPSWAAQECLHYNLKLDGIDRAVYIGWSKDLMVEYDTELFVPFIKDGYCGPLVCCSEPKQNATWEIYLNIDSLRYKIDLTKEELLEIQVKIAKAMKVYQIYLIDGLIDVAKLMSTSLGPNKSPFSAMDAPEELVPLAKE